MSKEEEEYYWAVERKKVVLMWLCLFCKTVCIAPAFGEPAVSSTVAPGGVAAWLPGQRVPVGIAASWGPAGCALLHFSLWQLPVCDKRWTFVH